MLPGPSIFASLSLALVERLAKFSPAAWKASISRPRLPPDSVTAARRLPFGGSAWTKHSVVSINSSRPRTRIPPSRVEIASKVSIEPASAPVCAIAAARPPSDAPSLSAITGFPAARAALPPLRKPLRFLHAFQINHDDADRGIGREIGHQVGGLEPGFVSGGDHVADADAAILQRLADRHHDRAGLSGDRHRSGLHGDDAVVDVG